MPESAVVRTGTRNIVFVVHPAPDGGAHVVPRELTLGPPVNGFFRVSPLKQVKDGQVDGIAEGELVATGAQFLIDSESRLKASAGGGAGGHGGH